MVRSQDALAGRTMESPESNESSRSTTGAHPVDPNFPDEHWYSVEFPSADLIELVRTPSYSTWQGERWLFCCNRPSVFIGCMSLAGLSALASAIDRGPVDLVAAMTGCSASEAKGTLAAIANERVRLYAFRCTGCEGFRATWNPTRFMRSCQSQSRKLGQRSHR